MPSDAGKSGKGIKRDDGSNWEVCIQHSGYRIITNGRIQLPLEEMRAQQHVIRAPNLKDQGYIRQKANNKLWVRERIAALLDQDSFAEVGSITGRPVVDDEGNLNSFVPA